MGTWASLRVGGLEFNAAGSFHGELFQRSDRQDEVEYFWADDEVTREPALVRPLSSVARRLDLLGYAGRYLDEAFDLACEHGWVVGTEEEVGQEQLFDAVAAVPLPVERRGASLEAYVEQQAAGGSLSAFVQGLDSYTLLQLLARNPANADAPVIWGYHPMLEAGNCSREDVFDALAPAERFLIVTEGSSDSGVIKKALELRRPGVLDFFRFIDMEKGYPFTGTGNLHRFCQGLVSMGVLNQVVVIYDNDAEGCAKWEATNSLALPRNMRVLKLLDLDSFTDFVTVGAQGESREDINGRGVAIECFLDLSKAKRAPKVAWKGPLSSSGRCQGALEDKGTHLRAFHKWASTGQYDFSKLDRLLDHVIAGCVEISQDRLVESLWAGRYPPALRKEPRR